MSMRLFRRIYSTYSLTLFALIFILMLPLFALMIRIDRRHPIIFWLHRVWAWLFYTFSFIPIRSVFSPKLDLKEQYIFCSNHFSYLDIPAIGINKVRPIFVGKHSLGKIPLFGYMYRNIHITLNRENLKSRYDALGKCARELDNGHNLVIFPEGGIVSQHVPRMARFKDGAFRLAIEKQVAIVPVTIPYNWILLPDDGSLLLKRHKNLVIFHDPIETKGLTMADLEGLKARVFEVIDKELRQRNAHAFAQPSFT
ncbi:MAG: 1-acyl-sn-glycerol-3-phosphate acyltransferase [Cyclobacteriaceae bacterium]|nr:1-acyl-sn-glycerol-3-phosphate acyltransferase [Cyclobacteriaceae bacterium]